MRHRLNNSSATCHRTKLITPSFSCSSGKALSTIRRRRFTRAKLPFRDRHLLLIRTARCIPFLIADKGNEERQEGKREKRKICDRHRAIRKPLSIILYRFKLPHNKRHFRRFRQVIPEFHSTRIALSVYTRK